MIHCCPAFRIATGYSPLLPWRAPTYQLDLGHEIPPEWTNLSSASATIQELLNVYTCDVVCSSLVYVLRESWMTDRAVACRQRSEIFNPDLDFPPSSAFIVVAPPVATNCIADVMRLCVIWRCGRHFPFSSDRVTPQSKPVQFEEVRHMIHLHSAWHNGFATLSHGPNYCKGKLKSTSSSTEAPHRINPLLKDYHRWILKEFAR